MSETVVVTGANGEIGHGLIPELARSKNITIIALDINELDEELKPYVHEIIVADILDLAITENLLKKHSISSVFHLAAILSTGAEKNPEKAHQVNVEGTSSILASVNRVAKENKKTIKFIFPSSIAVYGMPDLETKKKNPKINEGQYTSPITMYGINKLYCELLGTYYSKYYKLLDTGSENEFLDFRCLRFPGIISALTLPTGGTSDYAPEMIHSAAQGEGYESFVRPDTVIPFMVMPDAVSALIQLNEVPRNRLKQNVYNVTSFSASAQEIADLINKVFPDSAVSYNPDKNRQKIVDSWPADIDDSKARTDWNWSPKYNIQKSFSDYLIPVIQKRYKKANNNKP